MYKYTYLIIYKDSSERVICSNVMHSVGDFASGIHYNNSSGHTLLTGEVISILD